MEKSKDPSDIIRLGEMIAKQLGRANRDNFLLRWMAFRIAELIAQSESETTLMADASKREVERLILRVWQMRDRWPDGSPTANLAAAISALALPPTDNRRKNGPGYFALQAELDEIASEESKLCFHAELSRHTFEIEKEYLDSHSEKLSERERRLLRGLLATRESLAADPPKHGRILRLIDVSELERLENVREGLKHLQRKRSKVIRDVLKALQQSINAGNSLSMASKTSEPDDDFDQDSVNEDSCE